MAKIPSLLKRIIKTIPIAFTQNQRYDAQSVCVIRSVCNENSNCIDVGCHKGEIMDLMLKYAPKGKHTGFEPIPDLYQHLLSKYQNNPTVKIYNFALSDEKKKSSFNYVISNPSYSGLKKRAYDYTNEKDKSIIVECDTLDNIIGDLKIDLIKIDVEGGELDVLKGGKNVITKNHPIIIFEHGIGASDFYGTTPEELYQLLHDYGMKISLMKLWLINKPSLTEDQFKEQFHKRKNYYFIAYY